MGRQGRRESPVNPEAGPIQRFAHELRLLRRRAGTPTYRELAAHTGYSVSTLSQAAAGERLPSHAVALAYVRACEGDAAEWEERWRAASHQAASTPPDDADASEPPYRGLARFEPDDTAHFHGRDLFVAALLELAGEHRCIALLGASGGGKSSLLRAGLIPALRTAGTAREGAAGPVEEALDALPRPAAVRILTPGATPARTHAEVFTPATDAAWGEGETWVLVDQFEEVFARCHDPAERAAFLRMLRTAHAPERGLRVVLALRTDAAGRCAEHPALAEVLRTASLQLTPMDRTELREAVVRPAAAAGLVVERALTARLLDDADGEPGGLPLLSGALLQVWRRRRARTLTVAAYEAAGGLRAVAVAEAEHIYATLSPRQAAAARRILLGLVRPAVRGADTRRPASRAALCASPAGTAARGEVPEVLELLADARVLTLDGDRVDLAHEALLTWHRLRRWRERERRRLLAHDRLAEATRGWQELDRDPGALYRGRRLADAAVLFPEARYPGEPAAAYPEDRPELTAAEREFLLASHRARDRERRRRAAVVAAVCGLLTLACVVGVVAWQQHRAAEEQRHQGAARRPAAVDAVRAPSVRTGRAVRSVRPGSVARERTCEMDGGAEDRGATRELASSYRTAC